MPLIQMFDLVMFQIHRLNLLITCDVNSAIVQNLDENITKSFLIPKHKHSFVWNTVKVEIYGIIMGLPTRQNLACSGSPLLPNFQLYRFIVKILPLEWK